MEDKQQTAEVETKKSIFSSKLNLIGIAIIIALFAFMLGNRWDAIYSKAFDTFTNSANADLPDELDYTSVDELYDTLKRKYDGALNLEDIMNGIKKGLAESTDDPYTVYLSQEEAETFKADLNGEFTGIGAELGLDDSDRLIIIAPLEGFPAQEAGLRAGDIIIGIDDEDTYGISVEEAVTKIRGEEGTVVKLTINRKGEALDFEITRAKIVVPSVKSEVRDDGIGYIRISRFAEDTSTLARRAAEDFASQGVDKVILDVRSNGGGFLDSAVDVSGLWLESGTVVVEQRSGDVVTQTLKTRSTGPLIGVETVMLIDQGSASASEIVAGAMKDYDTATLLGVTSFGKGSVQALENLSGGGVLKVTIARWYTPKGINIDHEGIEPDVTVEYTEEDYENDNDPQLNAAVELLNK